MSSRSITRKPALRLPLLGVAFVALAACSGSAPSPASKANSGTPGSLVAVQKFAQGPISTACNANNRRSANRQTCGCIQAAANLTLSNSQQRRGAAFFNDPEVLQEMKLSDTPANERFWDDWARFAETAEAMCR